MSMVVIFMVLGIVCTVGFFLISAIMGAVCGVVVLVSMAFRPGPYSETRANFSYIFSGENSAENSPPPNVGKNQHFPRKKF
jgi:hypothetical protein